MMPSLMIDHLSINLRSGTDNLVSEISFAIKEGESLILLGQSGSGKTACRSMRSCSERYLYSTLR